MGPNRPIRGLYLSPSWPWEGYCSACWTLNPWEFQGPPPIVCALHSVPAHYLQKLVKYTDFPGGLGAILANKRALRWKPQLSLREGFLCSLPGPPIHMNGGSWRPVSLPSCCTLLLGRLWRINKVLFNQSINWPDSICTVCFLSAQSALCD